MAVNSCDKGKEASNLNFTEKIKLFQYVEMRFF